MTEFFGQPAPENRVEYCELCSERNEEGCPCEIYARADEEEKARIDEILEGE